MLSSVQFAGHTHESDAVKSPDAELIGKVLGADAKTGGAWQSDQKTMADFNAELTDAAAGRYVGQYAPRATTYSTVIRLSGAASDPAVEAVAARAAAETGSPVTVQYVDVVPMSALEDLSDQVRAEAQAQGIPVGDVWVDEAASQIAVEISDQSSDAQRETAAGIADATNAPYRVLPVKDMPASLPDGGNGSVAGPAELVYRAGNGQSSLMAHVNGAFTIKHGCLLLVADSGKRYVPVFPRANTRWDGDALVIGSQHIELGQSVRAGGGGVDATSASGFGRPAACPMATPVWILDAGTRAR